MVEYGLKRGHMRNNWHELLLRSVSDAEFEVLKISC